MLEGETCDFGPKIPVVEVSDEDRLLAMTDILSVTLQMLVNTGKVDKMDALSAMQSGISALMSKRVSPVRMGALCLASTDLNQILMPRFMRGLVRRRNG